MVNTTECLMAEEVCGLPSLLFPFLFRRGRQGQPNKQSSHSQSSDAAAGAVGMCRTAETMKKPFKELIYLQESPAHSCPLELQWDNAENVLYNMSASIFISCGQVIHCLPCYPLLFHAGDAQYPSPVTRTPQRLSHQ